MSIESLPLNPEEMLAVPSGWRSIIAVDRDTIKYSNRFSGKIRPNSTNPSFVLDAFNHAIESFPDSTFRFNVVHEPVSTSKLPRAVNVGIHTDVFPIFLACSSDPTWVEQNGVFRQLDKGELAFLSGDMRHHAPITIDEPGIRVRLKIFVDW